MQLALYEKLWITESPNFPLAAQTTSTLHEQLASVQGKIVQAGTGMISLRNTKQRYHSLKKQLEITEIEVQHKHNTTSIVLTLKAYS